MRYEFTALSISSCLRRKDVEGMMLPETEMRKPRMAASPKPTGPRPRRGMGASSVYQALREDILSLSLHPGTLLDETELSQRFGVSRSPVREALIRLSAEGLVRTLRNRSSIVAFFDVSEITGFFDALDLMYRVTARLAAQARDEAGIAAIVAAADAHRDAVAKSDVIATIDHNRALHLAIATATGNPYFVQWMGSVLDNGQRILRQFTSMYGRVSGSLHPGSHGDLVAAIIAGNADAAEAAARDDARAFNDEMLAFLGESRTDGLSVEITPAPKHAQLRRAALKLVN
jgi:DNA-binding GntR family transcriptional regulator